MKTTIWSILLVLAMIGAFVAGSWSSEQSTVTAANAGTRKILYYVDPMHPAYRSDKPGVAPDCGMDLVPVYADGGVAEPSADAARRRPGTVTISTDRQQLIGVLTGTVERTVGARTIRVLGRVAPDETRIYSVNAGVDGYIREVSAVTTGSRVSKDQWLASFFSLDARTPVQAYLTALDVLDRAAKAGMPPEQVRSGDATSLLGIERLKAVGMSPLQIDEIRRTREVPLMVRILAPADGFIVARNVTLGQKFDKGTEWFRIADLSRVWIVADVFGNDADSVRPGMQARISLPDEGRSIAARVSAVLPQFDATTRTLKVRLEADNAGFVLKPDMFVDVDLPVACRPAIVVPSDAVLDSGLRKTVFVDRGAGVFEPRDVETGSHFDDRVEIVKGLDVGERIVISGTFLLDSESRMKSAGNRATATGLTDPICGMRLDDRKARASGLTSQYEGRTYHFCSKECKHTFDKDPARYGLKP